MGRGATGAAFGINQHPRITTTYLNSVGRHGDPGPGLNLSSQIDAINGGTIGFSGGIVQPYGGFMGGQMTMTDWDATRYGDPALGNPSLYGGVFMYVRFDPAAGLTHPNHRGQVVFWQTNPQTTLLSEDPHEVFLTEYTVTPNPAAQTIGGIAGITLNETYNGNWDFIQVSGIAFVKFGTGATLQPGSEVQVAAGLNTAQTAPAITRTYLGTVYFTPAAANSVSPVLLAIATGRLY